MKSIRNKESKFYLLISHRREKIERPWRNWIFEV
jgi:hypothetical protein